MANLYISEYSSIGKSSGNTIQAPFEPPLAEQKISFTASTQSAALNAQTRVIRVHPDADCHIAIGSNPTATASNRRMIADQTEFLSIPQGSSLKIAAYDGTS